jgi:hypothetical protein
VSDGYKGMILLGFVCLQQEEENGCQSSASRGQLKRQQIHPCQPHSGFRRSLAAHTENHWQINGEISP